MSNTKHTPEPWHVQRNGKRLEVATEDTVPVASVNRRYDNSPLDGASTDSRTANAQLIAAAPDMLVALERWVEMMEFDHAPELATDHDGDGPDGCSYCEALEMSRAAINKATEVQS